DGCFCPARVELEAHPHRPGIVHPQDGLLLEVVLVERPERLDLHVALLAGIEWIEQHEDEAGLLHDPAVRLPELALSREQREPIGKARSDGDVEEILELLGAHLAKVGALAAEVELGAYEGIAREARRGVLLRERGCSRRHGRLRADAHGWRLE